MRAAIFAGFLVLGSYGCAGTREPGTDAAPDAIQSGVQHERTRPENIRIFRMGQLPYCAYRGVREINASRGGGQRDELQRRAFEQNADAVIVMADDGAGSVMGLAIVYTDPDCRY